MLAVCRLVPKLFLVKMRPPRSREFDIFNSYSTNTEISTARDFAVTLDRFLGIGYVYTFDIVVDFNLRVR